MAHRQGVVASPRSRAIILLLTILIHLSTSSGESEAELLIKFKESLKNNGALSDWKKETPPCNGEIENWIGLLCIKGIVWGLRLENMGLEGTIDVDSLAKLPKLRVLSFEDNKFSGPLPDLTKLSLKAVFLTNNKFEGELQPDYFDGMRALKKLHLGGNKLSGQIPTSLAQLPRLIELNLQDNEFVGEIPQFPPDRLRALNLSNNKLEGEVPISLSKFPASAFEGNTDLCGAPLQWCMAPSKLSIGTIVTLAILLVTASAALVAVIIILRRRRNLASAHPDASVTSSPETRHAEQKAANLDRMEKGHAAGGAPASSGRNMKITFLREDGPKFNMPDLLKASAEVLGSGVFGSTYKADLGRGHIVVVKRFKHMSNVSKQDFHEHMRRLGRLSHPNILPIFGYYYRKEEKLFVSDYVENFSLAVHLHGNTSYCKSALNWPTRLQIIKGVAKGLLYLHNELPSLTVPHGHLKSSNVLLDRFNNPLLNDCCLVPIVNLDEARQHMISYKSPEFEQSKRITKKTDVWSLGILIIEILISKFPPKFLQDGKISSGDTDDVTAWVESVVGSDPTPEVFDKSIKWPKKCETEMMKLLRIGLTCCQVDVDSRPDIKEAVDMIEEVKEG